VVPGKFGCQDQLPAIPDLLDELRCGRGALCHRKEFAGVRTHQVMEARRGCPATVLPRRESRLEVPAPHAAAPSSSSRSGSHVLAPGWTSNVIAHVQSPTSTADRASSNAVVPTTSVTSGLPQCCRSEASWCGVDPRRQNRNDSSTNRRPAVTG
jgi:hypothetical protein